MDEDFILTKLALEELKSLGYTEAWIGNVPNPHWEHGCGDGIIAAPKRKTDEGRKRHPKTSRRKR